MLRRSLLALTVVAVASVAQAADVNVGMSISVGEPATKTTVPRELPLGAALQWMEDAFGVRCVVREYGIVVTREDRVPPGALSASELWRSSEQSILGGQSPRASDPLVEQKPGL